MSKSTYKYIETLDATGGPPPGFIDHILNIIFFFIRANPDYDSKLHLVEKWYIEFEDDIPNREIGFNRDNSPFVFMPNERNYGFWCDTQMSSESINSKPITKQEFESNWGIRNHLDTPKNA